MDNRVENENVSSEIKALAHGPDYTARSFCGYLINGYRFHTATLDKKRTIQCSRVTLKALTPSFASSKDQNPIIRDVTYYGFIQEIIELDSFGYFKAVLFNCDWFHVQEDDYGLRQVNFKRLCCCDDPFVLVSKVHQVFYIQDSRETYWYYIMKAFPWDLFDVNEEIDGSAGALNWGDFHDSTVQVVDSITEHGINWLRDELSATTVELPTHVFEAQPELEINFSGDETLWDT